MIMSGNEAWNRNVFKRGRKVDRDGADITTSGRLFQMVGPATGKAVVVAVVVVVAPDTGGWRRRRVFVEHPAGHLQVLGQARHGLVERQTSVHVRLEVVLEDAGYGRQGAVSSLSPVRAAEDAAVVDWRQVGQLQQPHLVHRRAARHRIVRRLHDIS